MPYNLTRITYLFKVFIYLLLVGLTLPAHAQLLPSSAAPEQKQATPDYPADSLNRRTPRGTVDGFIQSMADQNYQKASQYLELKRSFRTTRQRARIVVIFQKLLDQSGNIVPTTLISNKYTGRTDDDLPENRDYVGTVKGNGEDITLYVENINPSGTAPLWQFSAETVSLVSAVTIEDTTLLDIILPEGLKTRKMGGVPLGHWMAVVVLIMISYILAWALVAFIGFIIYRVWKKSREEETWAIIKALGLPVRLYISLLFFVSLSQQVGISIIVRQRFSAITVTIGVLAFLILLWRLSDIISEYSKNRMTLRKRLSAISVILFLRRMAKVAIVIIGIIAILASVGFDVTAWAAALGIGGIALALGAQKTIENFVGSVTLIADQPIRVGDYCRVGDIKGTVEAIGIRSTQLRTGERTLVTIPNGEFSSKSIENYAHRDRFLFNPILGFRMETTPNQIRYLLIEIRNLLYAHASVNPEPAKVRFTGITDSAYKIEVYAYIEVTSLDAFQEVQEDLLLRILDIVAQSGTDFAYPTQTIYFGRDKANAEDKTKQAEAAVKDWKDKGEMQLPSFSPGRIEELKGTIKYPPEGAAVKR